jgi:RNA polymerase sigma factor (sigma-70 family)
MKTPIMPTLNRYRGSLDLEERLDCATTILNALEDPFRAYLFKRVPEDAIEDVLQEALIGIYKGLQTFKGNTDDEFWGWCYVILGNKANDELRKKKKATDHLEPFPAEEIWEILEVSWGTKPLPPEDRMDLEFAMNLLEKFKPDCRKLLWDYHIIGLKHGQIAKQLSLKYDAARVRIDRCMKAARKLVAEMV